MHSFHNACNSIYYLSRTFLWNKHELNCYHNYAQNLCKNGLYRDRASVKVLLPISFISDEEIRQTDGFKNVHLGNMVSPKDKNDTRPRFSSDEDHRLMVLFREPSFDIQVQFFGRLITSCQLWPTKICLWGTYAINFRYFLQSNISIKWNAKIRTLDGMLDIQTQGHRSQSMTGADE